MDEFRFLPLGLLHESPQNPRRHWNAAALDDLVHSIIVQGVLTPLLARPSREKDGHFELAAGHRRYRACVRAGVAEVPVRVRDMDDATFLEVLTIENLQREDVHPLDEADGYQALMDLDGAYTPEAIAAKVGKSKSYVYQRLKLRSLIPAAREAFLRDELTAAHAVRLARLTPELQEEALDQVVYFDWMERDDKAMSLAPVADLDRWVRVRAAIDVEAPETAALFPEVAAAVAEAAVKGATILQLSRVPVKAKDGAPAPLGPNDWKVADGSDACPHAQAGVIVQGYDAGRILQVCVTRTCETHYPAPVAAASAGPDRRATDEVRRKQQEQWKKEEARRELWTTVVRAQAFAAVAKKVDDAPVTPEVVTRVLDVLVTSPDTRRLITKAIGGVLTPSNMAAALLLAVVGSRSWDPDGFIDTGVPKAYGVDVRAMLKAAEKTAAARKAKTAPKKRRAA